MYAMYRKPIIPETGSRVGTGWLPPVPDTRDYGAEHPEVGEMLKKMKVSPTKMKAPPVKKTDLRKHCSPIKNQGNLGSCTAHAAVGIVEYFQNRAFKKHVEGSELFVYKATRQLMGVTGDTGAWLRNTMGALVLCGVAPEKHWPYTDRDPEFDREPPAFVYSVADNYETLKYFCHDPLRANVSPEAVLSSVRFYLSVGIPSMFGFWGFPSFDRCNVPGGIPFPCTGEKAEWGHAIAAVGYDDDKVLKNTACNTTTEGALLIRNSWGDGWGDKGYGWLPYEYVLKRLALDFWSLLKMEWVDTHVFDL